MLFLEPFVASDNNNPSIMLLDEMIKPIHASVQEAIIRLKPLSTPTTPTTAPIQTPIWSNSLRGSRRPSSVSLPTPVWQDSARYGGYY